MAILRNISKQIFSEPSGTAFTNTHYTCKHTLQQASAVWDLVTFTEKILNGKLIFCAMIITVGKKITFFQLRLYDCFIATVRDIQ